MTIHNRPHNNGFSKESETFGLAAILDYVAEQQGRILALEAENRELRMEAANRQFNMPSEVDDGKITVTPNIGKLLFKIFELRMEVRRLNRQIAMLLFNKNYDHAEDRDGGGE